MLVPVFLMIPFSSNCLKLFRKCSSAVLIASDVLKGMFLVPFIGSVQLLTVVTIGVISNPLSIVTPFP